MNDLLLMLLSLMFFCCGITQRDNEQMAYKADKTAAEKQQEYAEFLMMKKAEARYQEALEKLLASSHEEKSFARTKNDWYS
jgi:hypothetical protein